MLFRQTSGFSTARRLTRRAPARVAALALLAVAPVAGADEALLRAAMSGDSGQVRALAESGVDLNYVGAARQTALTLAAAKGYLPVVQELLARGAAVSSRGRRGRQRHEKRRL